MKSRSLHRRQYCGSHRNHFVWAATRCLRRRITSSLTKGAISLSPAIASHATLGRRQTVRGRPVARDAVRGYRRHEHYAFQAVRHRRLHAYAVSDAVRYGVRADGTHLYPAMPYPDDARIAMMTSRLLYAYFMYGVEAITSGRSQPNSVSVQYPRSMAVPWNFCSLDKTAPF